MGDLQRSAKMSYLQVLVPNDASLDFTHQLGKRCCMMVTDLNSEMQNINRPYMKDIIRLQEIEKTVDEIESILDEAEGVSMLDEDGVSIASVTGYDLKNIPRKNQNVEVVEAAVYESHRELKQQIAVLSTMERNFNDNKNGIEVYKANSHFLSRGVEAEARESLVDAGQGSYQADDMESGSTTTSKAVGFKYISGIVQLHNRHAFKRQVFLITRGNSFVLFRDIEDNEEAYTFMVLYLGDRFKTQLRRLCDFMNVKIYINSENKSEETMEERVQNLKSENERLDTVIQQTSRNLIFNMRSIAHKLKLWKIALLQEKAIRVVSNKFKVREQTLVCEGWCPTRYIELVEEAMEVANSGKGGAQGIVKEIDAPKGDIPPTHFETNKFTKAFQAIINTYGIPRYREYNPTVPSIITLPFLFAMMFGDMFHGAVVFVIALWLVLNERRYEGKKLNELLWWLYGGRYIILLMGFFSLYNGVIYNDCLSLSTKIWGDSAWSESDSIGEYDGVYPFGVDPTWHGKSNQIEETNSIKMKMSVLYGVAQMSFGLYLCMLNHVEFGDWISLIFEWIPQVMFMVSFFVYMCWIIIYKWCINWDYEDFEPPSLITVLVDFVLSPGTVTEDETQLYGDITFQQNLQLGLFMMMFISIPIMLLAKPCILRCKYGGKKQRISDYTSLEDAALIDKGGLIQETADQKDVEYGDGNAVVSSAAGHGHGHGEDFDFGEVMIHQMIHTIEYVLGTVSNTASYLRLWALSLAHAELSEVFYQKTLLEMMTSTGVMLFIGCTVFYAMTFAVLIIMDQLECFLHALRLHWVEFQNKFYNADGVEFEPFCYGNLVQIQDR